MTRTSRATGEAVPLRASTVAAHAMLAAARGQTAEARALFESTALLHFSLMPPEVGCVCYEWLATDSAARRDWAAVEQFAGHYRAPRVASLLLLKDIARLPPGKRRASKIKVWIARLQIPQRLSSPDGTLVESLPVLPANHSMAPARDAASTALYASIVSADNYNATFSLAEQWESALHDHDLVRRLAVRSTAIGGGDVAVTLTMLRRMVESDLVERLDNFSGLPASVPPALLNSALASRPETGS